MKTIFVILLISGLVVSLASDLMEPKQISSNQEDDLISQSNDQSTQIKNLADKTLNQPQEKGVEYSGEATYYADKYHGKATASGELYDKEKLTAAVRYGALPLAFGTMVEVTNLKSNKKVKVKVNDRMGKNASAIIDLSRAAAKKIGLITDGRAEVKIKVIKSPKK